MISSQSGGREKQIRYESRIEISIVMHSHELLDKSRFESAEYDMLEKRIKPRFKHQAQKIPRKLRSWNMLTETARK